MLVACQFLGRSAPWRNAARRRCGYLMALPGLAIRCEYRSPRSSALKLGIHQLITGAISRRAARTPVRLDSVCPGLSYRPTTSSVKIRSPFARAAIDAVSSAGQRSRNRRRDLTRSFLPAAAPGSSSHKSRIGQREYKRPVLRLSGTKNCSGNHSGRTDGAKTARGAPPPQPPHP